MNREDVKTLLEKHSAQDTPEQLREIMEVFLSHRSFLLVKDLFVGFVEGLSLDKQLLVVEIAYKQQLASMKVDLNSIRSKLEDILKESLSILHQKKLFGLVSSLPILASDLPNYSHNFQYQLMVWLSEHQTELQDICLEPTTLCRPLLDNLSTLQAQSILQPLCSSITQPNLQKKPQISRDIFALCLAHSRHGPPCLKIFLEKKASQMKHIEALEIVHELPGAQKTLQNGLKDFIQTTVTYAGYKGALSLTTQLIAFKYSIPEESIVFIFSQIVNCDDLVTFKRCLSSFPDLEKSTLKKIVAQLVDRESQSGGSSACSACEMLRIFVMFCLKNKDKFLELELTNTQYKFVILAILRGKGSNRVESPGLPGDRPKEERLALSDRAQEAPDSTSHFQIVETKSLTAPEELSTATLQTEEIDDFECIQEADLDLLLGSLRKKSL